LLSLLHGASTSTSGRVMARWVPNTGADAGARQSKGVTIYSTHGHVVRRRFIFAVDGYHRHILRASVEHVELGVWNRSRRDPQRDHAFWHLHQGAIPGRSCPQRDPYLRWYNTLRLHGVRICGNHPILYLHGRPASVVGRVGLRFARGSCYHGYARAAQGMGQSGAAKLVPRPDQI